MALEQYANDAGSTLSGPIGGGDGTLTVAAAAGFPASGDFRIRIEDELLLVTNVAGNVFTVTRGIEGTVAAAHADGVPVNQVLTKAGLFALAGHFVRRDLYANRPAAGTPGRLFIPTDGYGVFYDDGTNWQGQTWSGLPIPKLADFTQLNIDGTTRKVADKGGAIALEAGPVTGDNCAILYRPAPVTPYRLTVQALFHGWNVGYNQWGLLWRESATGKLSSFTQTYSTADNLAHYRWTNETTWFSIEGSEVPLPVRGPWPQFWRLEDDGTNRKMLFSKDGNYWHLFRSVARTDHLATPDQIGLYVNSVNTTYGVGVTLLGWREH